MTNATGAERAFRPQMKKRASPCGQPLSLRRALSGIKTNVVNRPAASYGPGETIDLDLHVVSDLRVPLEGIRLRAHLSWPGGSRTWWFEGDVGADTCVRVGALSAKVDEVAPAGTEAAGPATIELDLEWPDGKAHNRYDTIVRGRLVA